MADRFARPALVGLATLALLGALTPAAARTHHVATKHMSSKHGATTHATSSRHPKAKHETADQRSGRHAKKPEAHRSAGPAGVTSVPAGGLKVFCPHNSPLLIRKATQGAGTTVTVVCR